MHARNAVVGTANIDQQGTTVEQKYNFLKPPTEDWNTGTAVWDTFAEKCPFLGLRSGRWAFHNFLRHHRDALVKADAIRLAKNKFWIAHRERFITTSFELLTGKQPILAAGGDVAGAGGHGQQEGT